MVQHYTGLSQHNRSLFTTFNAPGYTRRVTERCQQLYSCIGCTCVCVYWGPLRLAKKVPHMMPEKVPPCMKSPAGYTRSPDMNKTVPGYQRYPYPYSLYFNKAVSGTRVFCRERTELTKLSGMGLDVVPNLPKCRVRVWMSYKTYQRVGYGYSTKLTKGSSTGMDALLSLPKGWVWHGCLYPYSYAT